MGYLIFPLKSSPSPSDKMREKKESGSVCPVPRTEEDMATTNGVDQEIPPEVGNERDDVMLIMMLTLMMVVTKMLA